MSESLGTNNDLGSVFDASISSYRERLLEPSSELLVQAFKYSFSPLFRPYVTRAQWTTVGEVHDSGKVLLGVLYTIANVPPFFSYHQPRIRSSSKNFKGATEFSHWSSFISRIPSNLASSMLLL